MHHSAGKTVSPVTPACRPLMRHAAGAHRHHLRRAQECCPCLSPRAAEAVLEQADRRFPAADSAALRMARWDIAHRRALHRGDLHTVRGFQDRLSHALEGTLCVLVSYSNLVCPQLRHAPSCCQGSMWRNDLVDAAQVLRLLRGLTAGLGYG